MQQALLAVSDGGLWRVLLSANTHKPEMQQGKAGRSGPFMGYGSRLGKVTTGNFCHF